MIQLSIIDLKELMRGGGEDHSFEIGQKYLIRTVTMHYTGKIERVTNTDVVLSSAAWIADTGRYSDSLHHGSLNEVEPYPDRVCVSRGAIVDFAKWEHELPRTQNSKGGPCTPCAKRKGAM